jgi:hypothetical protein
MTSLTFFLQIGKVWYLLSIFFIRMNMVYVKLTPSSDYTVEIKPMPERI